MTKEELLQRTLADLGKRYPVGLYEFLHENNRGAYDAILRVEDRIDQAYLTGSMGDLKAALRDYWKLHMEGIREFEQRGASNINIPLTRQKIEAERLRV